MKLFFLYPVICAGFSILACQNDDDPVSYDYHAHIMQPSGADKHIGDVLFIHVEFESHTGEAIEHVKVRIYNQDNQLVVYNEPEDPHISVGGSDYEFQDQFVLSAGNGLTEGDWVLEATVWGAHEGQDQIVEKVDFQVLP